MFIDRLLASDNIENRFDSLIYPSSEFAKLKDKLAAAVKFEISNVENYYCSGKGTISLPCVRPVYDLLWFEYKASQIIPNNAERAVGLLVEVNTKTRDKQICTIPFIELKSSRRIFMVGHVDWQSNEEGALGDVWVHNSKGESVNKFQGDNVVESAELLHLMGCFDLWLALSFLHCKNVSLNVIEPHQRLQRAREHRGKLPLVTYKTLEIKPMVKILREEGQSETQGLARALHICRGHFKDYSKGTGLFGRDKGMYWWESQVRGNITEGLVLKDYKVSPN